MTFDFQEREDTEINMNIYPNRPVVTTAFFDFFRADDLDDADSGGLVDGDTCVGLAAEAALRASSTASCGGAFLSSSEFASLSSSSSDSDVDDGLPPSASSIPSSISVNGDSVLNLALYPLGTFHRLWARWISCWLCHRFQSLELSSATVKISWCFDTIFCLIPFVESRDYRLPFVPPSW